MASLKGKRIAVIVTDGFEQIELTSPKEALEAAGAQVDILSDKHGKVQGMHHDEKGDRLDVTKMLSAANADDYDGLLLPGGVANGDALRLVDEARSFLKDIDAAKKPVAIICHGGWLAVSSGLVEGRTMTSWPSLQDDIRNAGGNWVDREVVCDGTWITSRKPDDLPAFNQAVIEALAA
jgi:protease I